MVGDRGGAATHEGSKEMHNIGMEVESKEFLEEYDMIDRVKCLGDVGCGDDGALGGFSLIKPLGNFRGEGKEGGDSGVARGEAVLERGPREVGEEEGAHQTFKNLRGGTK